MFHLACAQCHQPKRLDELHAWLYTAALCSPGCVEAANASGAYASPPAARQLLTETAQHLESAARLCGSIADAAVTAERARVRAINAMPRRGGLLGLAVGGAIGAQAQAEAERLEEALVDLTYQLHQHAVTVLRNTMGLNAVGYPQLLGEIQPLVTQYSGIVQPTRHPAVDHIGQLRAYLTHLHRGTAGLLAQS